MPSLSAYTPLEVFLFFQSLATLDAKPSNFSPVSDLLKNNSFVREDVTFDPERLGPQALEELYTTLVRDGIDDNNGTKSPSGLGQNGHGHRAESPGSSLKKRKLGSPSRRGPEEGVTHSTVVPSLVSHLYARYKERVTRDIQNEEKRYREIREEINRLENGDYGDAVPARADGPSMRPEKLEKPSPSRPEPAAPPKDTTGGVEKGGIQTGPRESLPVEGPVGAADGKPVSAGHTREPSLPETQKTQQPAPIPSRTPSGSYFPPAQTTRSQQVNASHQPQTVPYMATGHPTQPPQPSPVNGNIPFLPPPQQSSHGYRLKSPSASSPSHTLSPHTQQQTQPPQPPAGSMGVFSQNQSHTPSRSPVILPPPGANAPLGAPSPSRGSIGEASNAHHRTPSLTKQYPSPQQPVPPSMQPNFQQPWSPRDGPHTPYAHMSPYANAPYSNNHHPAGRPPPPNPTPYSHPEHSRPFQNPYAQPGQMVPGGTPGFAQSPHPSVEGTSFSPADRLRMNKSTPSQTPSFSSRRPPRLPSLDTTGSQTPWKKTPLRIDTSKSPGSPVRPQPGDVSPISDRAPSPDFEASRLQSAGQKQAQKAGDRVTKSGKNKKTVPPLELRNVPSFDSGKTSPIRTRRGGSTISSPVASSTRNRSRGRSITSRGEESITDPGSATQRKIKHEIPSTPADMEMSEDADVESRASRRRTTASQQEDGTAGRTKRKRGLSETDDSQQQAHQPPLSARAGSQYVVCTRNFPRTSAPIMNDVTAHKHASIFAKPLTERDAPGYKDLIFRPQDLKSIKSAIHQGSRAVTAATEAASTTPAADGESPSTGPGTTAADKGAGTPSTSKNATLTLKKTAELLPPKGIINSPQLEKELMRMFANAVMFNPTPERSFGPSFPMRSDASSTRESTQVSELEEGGIINDTKEMCDDVELAVTRWRAAERTADDA
ncbi:hypothetical protein FQN54_004180 [Arachnomyces sp. PD_36]|nr:hypothetical protein FQN54_004180 [Arachnomyces sp. PD_36]